MQVLWQTWQGLAVHQDKSPCKGCCRNGSAAAAQASCGAQGCISAEHPCHSSSLRGCAASLNEGLHECHPGLIFFGISYCLTQLIKAKLGCRQL